MLDSSPKVTRKPTICFRGASSQQNSFDEQNPPAEILYENEAETEFPNGGGKIQDCKCVVRICFDEQNPPAEILYENEAETEVPNGGGKIQDCKCVVRICFDE